MKSEWIKMRSRVLDDPKLIKISKAMRSSQPFAEWAFPDEPEPEKLCARLNGDAIRLIAVGVLLRFWSSAREHCLWRGDDGILCPADVSDVDAITQIPGFGAMMEAVGWLVVDGQNLVLPKFKVYNAPLTVAERQRAFRAKKAADVTDVSLLSQHRGEEKREDIVVPKPAQKAARRKNSRDFIFDAVAEVTGSDVVVTRGHIGKLVTLLLAASPPFTAEEVKEFGARFKEVCPYAARENRKPYIGEIEKYIGRIRDKRKDRPKPNYWKPSSEDLAGPGAAEAARDDEFGTSGDTSPGGDGNEPF